MMADRMMYDGVDVDKVPDGADVYAGYVDGDYANYEAMVKKFPNATHIRICVFNSGDAQVLDIEPGNATAGDAVAWVQRQRTLGTTRPTIYCALDSNPDYGWPQVREAFQTAGVAEPDYWIADQTGSSHPINGAVAVQWVDKGGYDISLITDPTWPA